MTSLPTFPYHPDPVATGSVKPAEDECSLCTQARGYVYVGPVYAVERVEGVCLWCIASGAAAREWGAEFTDLAGAPEDVPEGVLEEVARRTPGFRGWQQPHWMYHCGDGAAFLGTVGWAELQDHPDAIATLKDTVPEELLPVLDKDGGLTGYLFRCRHCGEHMAYADAG